MLRAIALAALVLASASLLVPAAAADPVTVGDCSKAGLCAAVCVGDDCPARDDLLCVGASYQVPQCVNDPTTYTTDLSASARCMGPVCEAVNAVCWIALKTWCVG